jgi:hypothetical protein
MIIVVGLRTPSLMARSINIGYYGKIIIEKRKLKNHFCIM